MSDGLQDLGALATAGLAARELEKRGRGAGALHAVDADGHDASHACANCATPLVGDFCHACGQVGHVHRTAGAFFHDIAHGVFHFEGRTWNTLPMLAFRPGALTRRYIDGERVRFVSPMALFLFSVFLMFASIGLATAGMDMGGSGRSMTAMNADLTAKMKEVETGIATLAAKRAKAVADKDTSEVADIDKDLGEERQDLAALTAARRALGGGTVGQRDGMGVNTGFRSLDEAVKHALANPELALYKMKTAAYKYSWALIPLSLPFIWLLFPFSRRFGFYDHAIFATYSLSFMTLMVVAGSLLIYAGAEPGIVIFVGMILAPIHMYKQLRGTYLLGRWNALARTTVLVFFTTFTLTLFGILLTYLGLA